jgi:hypothetical protein
MVGTERLREKRKREGKTTYKQTICISDQYVISQ